MDSGNIGPAAISERELEREALLRKEREAWLAGVELENKHNILFELESLLKGLDRFFNISNLPLTNMEQAITVNFIDEMEIVLQFVERVTDLSRAMLEASRTRDYQFKLYVGQKLMGDYERSRWREMVLEQRSPEDSLFVLYSTFENLKEMIRGLVQLKRLSFNVFFGTGALISREIASNRYFCPTRRVEFRVEYDRVQNSRISAIIRSVEDPALQRQASVVILAFNRLLHYLDFVKPGSDSIEELKSSLLFFSLIHSEAKYLMEFMEKNLPEKLGGSENPEAAKFIDACDSMSFQLQMELKKIHGAELLNLSKHRTIDVVKTAVENSHGILTNFFQQSVVQLLQGFRPGLEGEEIFPAFISRRMVSMALREDLAVLQALMDKFEEITETTEAGMHLDTYVKYLVLQKGYVGKLRKDTCIHMRHQDLVEFEKYFRFIEQLTFDDLHIMDELEKFKMESKFFKILVETTLGHIDNRADLRDVPLSGDNVQAKLRKFITHYLNQVEQTKAL